MDWSRLGPLIDTRPLYPLDRAYLLDLLGALGPDEWRRPTVPGWDVHDLAAHILHDHMRRLSADRDGYRPSQVPTGEPLPELLNRANEEFVAIARGLSPRLLIDLLAHLGPQVDAMWAARDLTAIGTLDVSWAAPDVPAPVWLDVARDYTEFWVHQQQIRAAVGRPGATEPELAGPVLDTFARALPHTLRDHAAPTGTTLRLHVPGPAGGQWTVSRLPDGWTLAEDASVEADADLELDPDTLWRLASRGITPEAAERSASIRGDWSLACAALGILSIVR
ncbi:maleylpyruvate isomerase family mycothiol-dependent enzyme [Streptosporangium sp. KLBMP 9127]|nr:maleylpyruvate isomerase family mycothiol-dependent enzyme [Streptosporangium sp. KLBMP 9127]